MMSSVIQTYHTTFSKHTGLDPTCSLVKSLPLCLYENFVQRVCLLCYFLFYGPVVFCNVLINVIIVFCNLTDF